MGWHVRVVFGVDELEVEVVGQQEHVHAGGCLDKHPSEANSLAPEEGQVAHGASPLAVGPQEPVIVALIEAFGHKLFWLSPLLWVRVEPFDEDLEVVALLQSDVSKLDVYEGLVSGSSLNDRVESHSLVVDHVEILQFEGSVERKSLQDVNGLLPGFLLRRRIFCQVGVDDVLLVVSTDLLQDVLVFGHVVDEHLGRVRGRVGSCQEEVKQLIDDFIRAFSKTLLIFKQVVEQVFAFCDLTLGFTLTTLLYKVCHDGSDVRNVSVVAAFLCVHGLVVKVREEEPERVRNAAKAKVS